MKPLRQLCAVVLLTTIFVLPVFAEDGQMPTPTTPPQVIVIQPPPTGGDPGEVDSVMQALLNILHGVIFFV